MSVCYEKRLATELLLIYFGQSKFIGSEYNGMAGINNMSKLLDCCYFSILPWSGCRQRDWEED